jgi:hypothetical protein
LQKWLRHERVHMHMDSTGRMERGAVLPLLLFHTQTLRPRTLVVTFGYRLRISGAMVDMHGVYCAVQTLYEMWRGDLQDAEAG